MAGASPMKNLCCGSKNRKVSANLKRSQLCDGLEEMQIWELPSI